MHRYPATFHFGNGNRFGPLEVFYSVIITIVICVACATTVIIAEGRDGRMASLSTIKSVLGSSCGSSCCALDREQRGCSRMISLEKGQLERQWNITSSSSRSSSSSSSSSGGGGSGNCAGVMPSKATESEAETIRRKLLSSYVRRLRAGGRENGSGNGGEESEKQNDKEKEEDDEEKDYKEKAGGEDNKATAPLLLPDLVDYSKEGTLDYSKFDKIIDSSDDEAMDDISEERIQAAKKELEEVQKDAAANGGNDTETYMMNMLRLKREKERKVARLEEEENKRLCVQTPNKWNGGKTNLYSFRQHIKNIEVYINMSATAIPGPYRGKNVRLIIMQQQVYNMIL